MTQIWTEEESKKLRALGIDPVRSDREKLLTLRGHFEKGGGEYAVSVGRKVTPYVSWEFARKIRDLTNDRKLDWIQGETQTGANPINNPHLYLRSLSVSDFTDGVSSARYATIEVANDSEVEATECWAWADVQTKGLTVPLHWAGTPITAAETDPPRISINKRKPARLDVAFAMATPNKEQLSNRPVTTSGDIVIYPREPRKKVWNGEGCWLAQPAALYNPDPGWESYLLPGDHLVRITVGCLNGQEDITGNYVIISTSSWEGLDIKQA